MANSKYISREDKTRDIKKALVHRSRIRKNYFKLLDKEGIDNEKPVINEEVKDTSHPDRTKLQNKPTSFAERAQIVKKRKEDKRKEELAKIQDRRKQIERKENERSKRKARVEKKTSRGQPLMGPRINTLLDKIKSDMK